VNTAAGRVKTAPATAIARRPWVSTVRVRGFVRLPRLSGGVGAALGFAAGVVVTLLAALVGAVRFLVGRAGDVPITSDTRWALALLIAVAVLAVTARAVVGFAWDTQKTPPFPRPPPGNRNIHCRPLGDRPAHGALTTAP